MLFRSLDREGPTARILIYASNFHITARPHIEPGPPHPSTSLGMHLRQTLGGSLVTIGNVLGGGSWGCAQFVFAIPPRSEQTMDRWVGELGYPRLFLDLRTAPAGLDRWLNTPQPFGAGSDTSRVEPSRAYDLLVYYDQVGPVCPTVPR